MKLINGKRRDSTYSIVKITILYMTIELGYIRVLPLKLVGRGKRKKKNN